jgi:hypothetical protein
VTEIPEHLLNRSKARRAEAPSDASGDSAPSSTPAVATPATQQKRLHQNLLSLILHTLLRPSHVRRFHFGQWQVLQCCLRGLRCISLL